MSPLLGTLTIQRQDHHPRGQQKEIAPVGAGILWFILATQVQNITTGYQLEISQTAPCLATGKHQSVHPCPGASLREGM